MRKLPVTELQSGVFLLDEFSGTNCYLVVGSEKALLIDCGTGVGDLTGTIRDITPLPVEVIITHGHCDHFGGAFDFPQAYIHKDDLRFVNRIQFTQFARRVFTRGNSGLRENGFTVKDLRKRRCRTRLVPIEDGFTLSLGDKTIRVKHTPGHSHGSIAVIDDADKVIFTGDNCGDALWLFLPGRTSVEEWIPSAEWLYEQSETYRVFWGHRVPELTHDYIGQVLAWGKEILASRKKNAPFPKTEQHPKRPDGIVYKTNTIFKRSKHG